MANNPALYDAVIAGGIGGAHERWLTNTQPSSYATDIAAVVDLASEVDAAIPTIGGGPSISQINLLQSIIQGVVANRNLRASDFAGVSAAIAALFSAGSAPLFNQPTLGGAASPVASFFGSVADASSEPAINDVFYTAPLGGAGWYRISAVLRPADITTDCQIAGFPSYTGPAATQIPLFQFRASSEGGLASAILVPADFYLAEGETISLASSGTNVIVGVRLDVVQLGP